MNEEIRAIDFRKILAPTLIGIAITAGLFLISRYNYLFFHVLAEGFSIVVAGAIFALVWNTWELTDHGYLQFLGIAFLFIGGLDLMHTLTYKGMGIFPGYDANLPTQLWIAARYTQSLSFLTAPVFLHRRVNRRGGMGGFTILTAILLILTFTGIFPDCYVEGQGLTRFKVVSEYLIALLLGLAILRLRRHRYFFGFDIFHLLVAAIGFTIISELAFTFYVSVYGLSNLIGHVFKIFAFYCIYHAIVETGLRKPYALLFRDVQERNTQLAAEVAERKRVEQSLRRAKEEAESMRRAAEAANRAKSVFLANMSHELRTPLNAILGYAQLMARDPHITRTHQAYLETIARSGEHLLGLINDVLTMSKIEAGRTVLQENAFDLHHQLQGLQEMFKMRAEDKHITLLLEIAPDVPRYVYADEGKLRQILMNLISNAVKFTTEGGVTLRVGCQGAGRDIGEVAVPDTAPPILLCFEVEDSGVGIAPEEMDVLFDPFVQTTSGQSSQEGTGLGLPISQQFVSLMRGELSVSSVVGRGTCFRVQVPVALADEDAVEAPALQPHRRVTGIEAGQTAPDGGAFRILVVEDKHTNRELLERLLTPFGFDVRIAVNGEEGVAMWEAWQPHLVWMDMRMPVMDGYEATRQIKARAAAMEHSAIVVALTASAFEEERAAVLAAGCDDFIRKPFRERDIFNVLHRYLGVRFIYEPVAPAPAAPERGELEEEVSLASLRATVETLPSTWAEDLYQATVTLNAERMLALVKAVHPQTPHLADTLTQWIHDFEYERLMTLVKPEA